MGNLRYPVEENLKVVHEILNLHLLDALRNAYINKASPDTQCPDDKLYIVEGC